MWYDERSVSWNNMKMSSLIVEEWRDLWSFKLDFLVAAFAYVFATTNILNLPRLIIENGGLAFVAAYAAALFVCVLPIIVLELAVGQMTGRAPVQAFYNICPLFKGVGVAQFLFSLVIMSFLAFYVGWLLVFLYYLFWSIYNRRVGLPWLDCADFSEFLTWPCIDAGSELTNNDTLTARFNVDHVHSTLSQFISTIQRPTTGITDIGEFQLYLLAALGAVWILVFIAIFAGVRWLGKVIHFTFLLPFILLAALLARSLTLDGLMNILEYFYATTDWNRMLDYEMWSKAVEQAIWATGIGFGAFITIGSYNRRTNNLVGDSLLIIIVHIVLTCMQVMSIVGLVGYISARTSLEPLDLLSKGETQMWHLLAYLSYLPMTTLWSGIVLVLSIFVLLNIFYLLSLTMLSTLEDAFGEKWSRCLPRLLWAFVVCSLGFASGLFYTTQAGRYAIELVRGYSDYVTLWTILAFELLAVAWFYCAHQLGNDLRSMLPNACCWVLGHFLLYITYLLPVVPIYIMLLKVMHYDYAKYSDGIRTWQWSEYVGWTIALIPLLPIPLLMIFTIIKKCVRGPGITKWQRFKYTIISPLRYEISKPGSGSSHHHHHQRYTASAPGYVLLPQAPLAEPEQYNDGGHTERVVRVSNI